MKYTGISSIDELYKLIKELTEVVRGLQERVKELETSADTPCDDLDPIDDIDSFDEP